MGISRNKSHETIVQMVTTVTRAGRILDAAAGSGEIARRLQETGLDVYAADINPVLFHVPNMTCDRVDLNQKLPYDNEFFDLIVCSSAIEHLEDQYCFVREAYRTLKPAGKLLITTPNLLSLKARMAHLFVGWPDFNDRPQNEVDDYLGGQHINMVTYFDVRANLHRNGFRIAEVRTNMYSRTALSLAVLVPFLYGATLRSFKRERNATQRERNKEIVSHVMSKAVLFGKKLFLLAEKNPLFVRG
jgi:SAM-dependent methyltransferase